MLAVPDRRKRRPPPGERGFGQENKMTQSPLRLIEPGIEHLPVGSIDDLPEGLRGIYALFDAKPNRIFNVVYVGMSDANIR